MLCKEIEPNPLKDKDMHEGNKPSSWDALIDDRIYHIRIFKQIPKYLATGLRQPQGTNSPAAKASTQGWNVNLKR
jgi:hypothetical protein